MHGKSTEGFLLKTLYCLECMHLRAKRRRQGKRRGVNDDEEVLKGEVKALSGDGEALKDDGSIEGRICVKLRW